MKKVLWLFNAIFISMFIGCNNSPKKIIQKETPKETTYDITIQDPIVFSKNSVAVAADKAFFVNIEMISGKYSYDEAAGALHGNNWIGKYQIRVYTNEFDFNSTVYLAPISIIDNQAMNFRDEFSLVFDDYNNDGNPDFTLGQYRSSNGYDYAVFSISQDGRVEMLDTGGSMFISERDYSIKLEKLTPTSFKKSCYDNSLGETVENIYEWKDNKFMPL